MSSEIIHLWNFPPKCPKCGAKKKFGFVQGWLGWECGSFSQAPHASFGAPLNFMQGVKCAAASATNALTPKHYDKAVTPWDLERCMESSGNAFVDARRTDAIEYVFRIKDDLLDDLRKARHCIDEAITELSKFLAEPPP